MVGKVIDYPSEGARDMLLGALMGHIFTTLNDLLAKLGEQVEVNEAIENMLAEYIESKLLKRKHDVTNGAVGLLRLLEKSCDLNKLFSKKDKREIAGMAYMLSKLWSEIADLDVSIAEIDTAKNIVGFFYVSIIKEAKQLLENCRNNFGNFDVNLN